MISQAIMMLITKRWTINAYTHPVCVHFRDTFQCVYVCVWWRKQQQPNRLYRAIPKVLCYILIKILYAVHFKSCFILWFRSEYIYIRCYTIVDEMLHRKYGENEYRRYLNIEHWTLNTPNNWTLKAFNVPCFWTLVYSTLHWLCLLVNAIMAFPGIYISKCWISFHSEMNSSRYIVYFITNCFPLHFTKSSENRREVNCDETIKSHWTWQSNDRNVTFQNVQHYLWSRLCIIS